MSLLEILIATAVFATSVVPMLYVLSTGQRLARAQPEASDLQQRVRVAADKLQRDLAIAGAGAFLAPDGLARYVPPIVPARTGLRSSDPELSAVSDRISLFYVPDDGSQATLARDMSSPGDVVTLNAASPGCVTGGLCGFTDGMRALVYDPIGIGGGYDLFTITGIVAISPSECALSHGPPNGPFSQAYRAGSVVVPIVQRVYHFDAVNRRLMVYDGYQSDMPLVDHVADVRFEYFGQATSGDGLDALEALPLAQLRDGLGLGVAPTRFDPDLLRIRLVRVTLRLDAAADEVRGAGPVFSRPGRSTSAYSYVPDYEISFDVAPRNMAVRR